MSLIKCNECGEMFSDSYKQCPFCLEDEDFNNGRKPRNPGRRVQKPKAPSIIGPAMLVVVLLLAAYLVYTFLGSDIAAWFGEEKDGPVVEQPVEGDDEPGGEEGEEDPTQPEVTVTLDKTALVLEAGKSGQLTASGAEGITFHSSDEAVATVDAAGKVTAVSVGSATVTATAEGAVSAACVVTVNAAAKKLEVVTEYGAQLWSPNKAFSVNRGSSVDLKVAGTDSTPTWQIEDTSIATVDSNGVVKGKSKGTTKLIVSVDGQTIRITVTVS